MAPPQGEAAASPQAESAQAGEAATPWRGPSQRQQTVPAPGFAWGREAAKAGPQTSQDQKGATGSSTEPARQRKQADWLIPRGARAYGPGAAYRYRVPGATPYGQAPYGRGPYQPVPYDRRFPSTPAGQ
ncbi:MAG: hypothetical protein PVG38_05490 [Gammaproteobacteria bacterium]|jgi:hypothetical protein